MEFGDLFDVLDEKVKSPGHILAQRDIPSSLLHVLYIACIPLRSFATCHHSLLTTTKSIELPGQLLFP